MSPSPIDLTNGSIHLKELQALSKPLNMQQMSLPPLCPLSHHRVSKAIVSRESRGVTPLPPAGQPRVSRESGIAEGGGKRRSWSQRSDVNAAERKYLESEASVHCQQNGCSCSGPCLAPSPQQDMFFMLPTWLPRIPVCSDRSKSTVFDLKGSLTETLQYARK